MWIVDVRVRSGHRNVRSYRLFAAFHSIEWLQLSREMIYDLAPWIHSIRHHVQNLVPPPRSNFAFIWSLGTKSRAKLILSSNSIHSFEVSFICERSRKRELIMVGWIGELPLDVKCKLRIIFIFRLQEMTLIFLGRYDRVCKIFWQNYVTLQISIHLGLGRYDTCHMVR